MATNLSEYYASQKQALPSVSERKATASKAGIQNYTGTAQQNAQLLSFLQSSGTPTKINSQNLKPNEPLVLPDAKTPTYGGMQGAIEQVVADTRTQQEKERDQALQQKESASDAYLKAILEQGNISSSVDRTEQDTAKKQADEFTSQLEQEALANRRRIEEIQKNAQGALAGGVAIEAERVNRESLSKQADLAILQTAANRRYDTAAAIADRAVALKMEQSNAQLSALKFFYENNKERFDKLDDRVYSELLAKKEAENKRQLANEEAIKQLKLNVAQYGGGASLLSQLSAIDTTKPDAFDKAVAIAGKYASDPLDRAIKSAQLSKIKAESTAESKLSESEKKSQQASSNLVNLLGQYKTAITGVNFIQANRPEKKVEIENLKGRISAEYKQAKQLGTLDAGVERLIDKIIPDPTRLSLSSLSNSAQVKAIDQTIKDFQPQNTGEVKNADQYVDSIVIPSLSGNSSISGYINSLFNN